MVIDIKFFFVIYTMNEIKKYNYLPNLSLAIGIVFIIAYSLIYIYSNSYILEGIRYFSLFDDAMISMRYAENIANGFGPVWNIGEPAVEGFSNPLWVYIMAIVHLFPIAQIHISLVIQFFAIIILSFNTYYIKKLTELFTDDTLVISASILISAMYLHLLNWSIQGMEVSLITLFLTISIYFNLKNYSNDTFSILQFIIPAISILVRMDAILFYIIIVAYLCYINKSKRKVYLTKSVIVLLFTLIILFSWRQYYFAEWLPNTYYLKMTGYSLFERLGKGFYVFLKFVLYLTPVVFILPYYHYFITKEKKELLLLSSFSIMILYSIYIGGDSWEWWLPANRFISSAIPLFIITVLLSIKYLISKYLKKTNYTLMFVISSILILIAFNYNSMEYLRGEIFLEKTFTEKDNRNQTRLALSAKQIMDKSATAAVAVAGTLPYFLERNCIDLLGKNDKAIARMVVLKDSSSSFLTYNPGHEKWNYAYSIGELKPDIILHLWSNPITALPYLSKDYIPYELAGNNVFLRKDSKNIFWDKVKYSQNR